MKLFQENWVKAHYEQYHPMSINKGLLPDVILPPAGRDRPEPSWFHIGRCTEMAIDKLSTTDLPIGNVTSAPSSENTPGAESTDPQNTDLPRTPDSTKIKTHWEVIGVENAGEKE